MATAVYVSRCGGRLGVIDLESALVDVARTAERVRVFDDFFEASAIQVIENDIAEAGLDSVVLAGNSVGHYVRSLSGGRLKERIAEAGVNPNRIVAANLLEQVALAHPDDPVAATAKARALVNVAMLRATTAEAAPFVTSEPRKSVLVLGVSTEALVAAMRLLQLGFSVVIADRDAGSSEATKEAMRATASFVLQHPKAKFVDQARLTDGEGWAGDYRITLSSPNGPLSFEVGGILLARPDSAEWIEELRPHFKVDIDHRGYARSLDPSAHPAETVDPGIMVVPVRETALSQREKVSAADSAAMALVLRLSSEQLLHYDDISSVDESLCGACASCVKTCAFGACTIGNDGLSHVDRRRCRGCGKCVVSCPVGARDIISAPHDYLLDAVRELAHAEVPGPRVLGFLCGGCGYPAADSAAEAVAERGEGYSASFLPLRIPCGGRLDTLYVLEAFKQGFDGVTVYRCREGHCHNLIGNLDMDRRINLLRTVLRSRGIDDARLRIVDISPGEGERFIETVESLFDTVNELSSTVGGAR